MTTQYSPFISYKFLNGYLEKNPNKLKTTKEIFTKMLKDTI